MQPINPTQFTQPQQMQAFLKKYAFQGHHINQAAQLLSKKGSTVTFNSENRTFIVEKKGERPVTVDLNEVSNAKEEWTLSRIFMQLFNNRKIEKLADQVFNKINPPKSPDDPRTKDLYDKIQKNVEELKVIIDNATPTPEKNIDKGMEAFKNKEWSKAIDYFEKLNESPLIGPYKKISSEVISRRPNENLETLEKEIQEQMKAIKRKQTEEGKRIMTPSASAEKALQYDDAIAILSLMLSYVYMHRALEGMVQEHPDKKQFKADTLLADQYMRCARGGGLKDLVNEAKGLANSEDLK